MIHYYMDVVGGFNWKAAIIFIFVSVISASASGQSILDIPMTGNETGKRLTVLLTELENQHPVKFYYLNDWIADIIIQENYKGFSLAEMLDELFRETELSYIEWGPHSIVFVKDPIFSHRKREILTKAANDQKKIEHVQLGTANKDINRKDAVLRGRVYDAKDSSPMHGVTIAVADLNIGTLTDAAGNFEIKMPLGKHILGIGFIGYEERIIDLEILGDSFLETTIEELARMLDEIVVTEKGSTKMATSKVGQLQISIKDMKRSPSFLGMTDIIKQVQTQSGVTTVSEASSGFNVRGGGVDQNLILFDGVPVFNTSHALGFFTAFNAESINRATFYKGGIPAEFGGRVSSVLDIGSREGSYEKWKGTGGIGLVSADLAIGGPIKKDTSSLTVSVRSSYSDWMLNYLKTHYKSINDGSVFFYDASFKFSQKFSAKDKLIISGYTSYDKFRLVNDTINQWQNFTLSARYDHAIRTNFYYSVGLSVGNYQYKVIEEDPSVAFQLNYKVTYPSIKLDITKDEGRHKFQYGAHFTYYRFKPGNLIPTSAESTIRTQKMDTEASLESALYFSDVFKWSEKFTVEAGMRLSMFNRLGPGMVYHYLEGEPLEVRNIIDSTYYKPGAIMKTYVGPEPRLSLMYLMTKQSSIKLGYNHMYQYLHLVSNTATITPVDIWQSSNTYFQPQRADQVSIGYFMNSKNDQFEFSIEGFYKRIAHLLDFKDGSSLILNKQLETALLPGRGKAYGVEVTFNKLKGKFTWATNYTYSRSFRKVDGAIMINQGDWYPSNYDQPNIVNFNWRLELARKVFFTGFFTYHTGRPVSLPVGVYSAGSASVTDFSERNNFRIPDYHRLDLALIIEGNNKKKKKWEGSWAFSFYNVYARQNPYSVYFADKGNGTLVPYQLSLIGTMVPSVTYRFKF